MCPAHTICNDIVAMCSCRCPDPPTRSCPLHQCLRREPHHAPRCQDAAIHRLPHTAPARHVLSSQQPASFTSDQVITSSCTSQPMKLGLKLQRCADPVLDTKALLAWSRDSVVLSFRGRAGTPWPVELGKLRCMVEPCPSLRQLPCRAQERLQRCAGAAARPPMLALD